MTTFIAAGDAASPLISGAFFKFFEADEAHLLKMHFICGFTGCVLFALFIPESPRWLFLQKGTNSQEAIKALNYIAWFNGSPKRVPSDATFDLIGQVIEEQNATVNMSVMSRLTQNMNKSHIQGGKSNKASIFKEFRQLYLDKRYSYDHWKVKILFTCMYNIYFLAIFNYKSIEGDIFTLAMLFGAAEFMGLIFGEPLLKIFPDWLAMMFSLSIVMVCSVVLKMKDVE